jgi:NADH dehydrogenase [ubiquinone] 1 alpha subcomplex assembly factor 6
MKDTQALSPILLDLSRKADPDRYFSALFAPASDQKDLMALIVFYHEIAKTRDTVSETTLGLIRLQWWKDGLRAIYQNKPAPSHFLFEHLKCIIENHNLAQDDFELMIHGREFDLENMAPADLKGLQNYLDYTSTPLLKMMGNILNVKDDSETLKHLAIGYGLIGLIRSTLFLAKEHRCLLPQDLLDQYQISLTQLYDFKAQDNLKFVIKACHQEALCHLKLAKPKHAVFKAQKSLALLYAKHIEKCSFDIFDQRFIAPPAFKELRVTLSSLLS